MAIGKKLLTILLYLVAGVILTWAIWVGPGTRGQACENQRFIVLDRSVLDK